VAVEIFLVVMNLVFKLMGEVAFGSRRIMEEVNYVFGRPDEVGYKGTKQWANFG